MLKHAARWILGGLLVAAGGLLAATMWFTAGAPAAEHLATATGAVDRVWTGGKRHETVFFELRGVPDAFVYHARGGKSERVRDALESSRGQPVTVRHDPDEFDGPLWDRRFHPVYELRLPFRLVRSLEDVDAAYRADDRIGAVFGIVLAAIGLAVLVLPSRLFRGRPA